MPNRFADPTPRFKTQRGDMVRSLSENYIANYLFNNRIDYEYEKPLILDDYEITPDFYLPAYNVYIEFWGMLDDRNPQYWKNFKWKVDKYFEHQIKFVPILPQDLPDLDRVFPIKLKQAIGKYCTKCGFNMKFTSAFCSKCGTKSS